MSKARETENEILQQLHLITVNQAENAPPSLPDLALCGTTSEFENSPCQNTTDSDASEREDFSGLSSSDESEPEEMSLQAKLMQWASTFGITLVAVTALLSILRVHHSELPKDARTLLGTQKKIAVHALGGGEYHHFGLAKGILSKLNSIHLPIAAFRQFGYNSTSTVYPFLRVQKFSFGQFLRCLIVITQKTLLLLVCFVELENHLVCMTTSKNLSMTLPSY